MTLTFAESFWGDKNNGFEIIYHNFKEGVLASKEFGDFVSAVFAINDLASNNFKKLVSTKGTSSAASPFGSFAPLSLLLKTYAEHMSGHYGETAKRLQDLMTRVQKYAEQQKERQKQVRESEAATEQLTKNIRELSSNLQRCKEDYHRRCMEYEKARRAETPPQQKELDRLEARARKSREDYRQIIDRFNSTREDFERKMKDSCGRLQEIEEAHLDQMKAFIAAYFEVIENSRKLIMKAEEDSRANIAELSREKLLEIFIKTRTTGSERPATVDFEEPDLSQLPPLAVQPLTGAQSQPELIPLETSNRPNPTQPASSTTTLNNLWNIVKPRTKAKQKRTSKDITATPESDNMNDPAAVDGDSLSNETPEPGSDPLANSGGFQQLDANGFWGNYGTTNGDGNAPANDDDDSFDSDSDDGVSALKQLKIKEKGEANGSYGTVEDISQIMRNVTLNPGISVESKHKRTMKKSLSVGGSNNHFFVTGSQSSFELNRSPLSNSMTPEDINKAFDPLYVSPNPSSAPTKSSSAPRPTTPATASDIHLLFSTAFPDQGPTTPFSNNATIPPPVAERRTQTPKPPSPPVSPFQQPPNERVASPTPRIPPPTIPPPVARTGPPPPPPARTRLTVPDSSNNPDKVTLRRQPESASAVLASIPEVSVSSAAASIPVTNSSGVSPSPAPVGSVRGSSGAGSSDDVDEIQEALPKKTLQTSQSTSALPIIRPRSHTPQATSNGSAFISPPPSSSGDDTSVVSQSPMASNTMPMVSTEASSPSFATSPSRQTPANEITGNASAQPTPVPVVSRGPSPYDGLLPLANENLAIPIGVYFSESIDAVCRGLESSQCCGLKVAGRLTVSFPVGFARIMSEVARGGDTSKTLPHPLMFRVSPVRGLHQVHHYRQLVAQIPSPLADSLAYRFEMSALAEHLAKQYEAHKSNTHFNIDILKYELKPENCMHASPLAISYRWQQAFGSDTPPSKNAALHLVVRHRGVALCPVPLKNPTVSLTVDNLENVVATPSSTKYDAPTGRIAWQLPDLTASSPDFLVNADLRFKDTNHSFPPHLPLSVTFDGDGHLFSSLKFDLVSIAHYRISLFRKLFKSGRYDVEPDGPSQLAYV